MGNGRPLRNGDCRGLSRWAMPRSDPHFMNAAFLPEDALREWRAKLKKEKRRQYPESELASALCRWFDFACVGLGVPDKRLFFHCKNEGRQSARAGARMKSQAVRAGVADYLLLVPRGPYHGLAIELKSKDGKLSKEQKEWMDLVQVQGYAWTMVRSLDEGMSEITKYLRS